MKKTAAIIFLIVFGIIGYYFFSEKDRNKIIINDKSFFVETVSDEDGLTRGLGGRNELCDNCGMLFDFKKSGKYSFWMKDMNFPLDIIWISDGKIVYIANNVSKDSKKIISPNVLADKVLEINGGLCEKDSVKVGDHIKLDK